MPTFLELIPLDEALDIFLNKLPSPINTSKKVKTFEAYNEVLMEDITAKEPLPAFSRSTVDGFAVNAADTYGASDSLPAYLPLIGEVPMGGEPEFELEPQTTCIIHTGGMLPQGANAVVMIEDTQYAKNDEIEIYKAVADGENIIEAGEDVKIGDVVLKKGTRIEAAQLGGLLALGILEIKTAKTPIVGILSSGDEVVEPFNKPHPGQVRDINSYTLKTLVQRWGGTPKLYGIVPDHFETFQSVIQKAFKECDMVIVTAGSSASARDLTSQVIQNLGEPGVLVHGVRIRPGKPTILAVCGGKPVIGLPGNPVSALVIANLFVVPAIERLLGITTPTPRAQLKAKLCANYPSIAGREDYVPVKLDRTPQGYDAHPIFFKSNMIFTLAQADGLLHIPADAVGLEVGKIVDIFLF
jgi:molybdopterin molybdotransferase